MAEQQILSDTQFAALLAAFVAFLGSLVATTRWAVGRVVKALDENSKERLEHAKAFVSLTAKIDEVHDWMQDHTPVEEQPVRRARTNPGGVPIGEYSFGKRGRNE